jgi:hypothetical protein
MTVLVNGFHPIPGSELELIAFRFCQLSCCSKRESLTHPYLPCVLKMSALLASESLPVVPAVEW